MIRFRTVAAVSAAVAGCAALLTAGPAQAAGSVHLYKVYYDSPGSDLGGNASLNAEWVQLKNSTATSVSLKGWTLTDASNHRYTFPAVTLKAGAIVAVHTGKGANNSAHLYQGRAAYVWNNDKDTATLRRSTGGVQSTCSYNSTKVDYKVC